MRTGPLIRSIRQLRKTGISDWKIQEALEEQGFPPKQVHRAFAHLYHITALVRATGILIILVLLAAFAYMSYTLPDSAWWQTTLQPDIDQYRTDPKTQDFSYHVDGTAGNISITTYQGMADHLAGIDRQIRYFGSPPSARQIELRFLDNKRQRLFLRDIAAQIRNISTEPQEQARIAISLVQRIPYEQGASEQGHIRYSYEVLHDHTGVCSEKSRLLVGLLRELGFGTAILRYRQQRHDAAGIACDPRYDTDDTGFCFIETSSPSIITDSYGIYPAFGALSSSPEVITISEGMTLSNPSQDYTDALRLKAITNKKGGLTPSERNELEQIRRHYGLP